jgi:hypothetical protein
VTVRAVDFLEILDVIADAEVGGKCEKRLAETQMEIGIDK